MYHDGRRYVATKIRARCPLCGEVVWLTFGAVPAPGIKVGCPSCRRLVRLDHFKALCVWGRLFRIPGKAGLVEA